MTDQTVTVDEKEQFEKEKTGLIKDLAEQRKENRNLREKTGALEQRLAQIETSLSQEEPSPADVRVQKFAQDPDAYIKEVVAPLVSERIQPLEKVLTQSQLDRKLENAMEFIAEEKGITKRQAAKKYEKKLAEVVESHGFGSLDPYDGTIAAFKILEVDEKESEKKEKEREERINGQHTETGQAKTTERGHIWKTSEIAKLSRGQNGEFNKHADEILRQQREGLIIRDT